MSAWLVVIYKEGPSNREAAAGHVICNTYEEHLCNIVKPRWGMCRHVVTHACDICVLGDTDVHMPTV